MISQVMCHHRTFEKERITKEAFRSIFDNVKFFCNSTSDCQDTMNIRQKLDRFIKLSFDRLSLESYAGDAHLRSRVLSSLISRARREKESFNSRKVSQMTRERLTGK